MKVHLCLYEYNLKPKLFISIKKIFFYTSEFSDDPLSFIIKNEIVSGRDLQWSFLLMKEEGSSENFKVLVLRSKVSLSLNRKLIIFMKIKKNMQQDQQNQREWVGCY